MDIFVRGCNPFENGIFKFEENRIIHIILYEILFQSLCSPEEEEYFLFRITVHQLIWYGILFYVFLIHNTK